MRWKTILWTALKWLSPKRELHGLPVWAPSLKGEQAGQAMSRLRAGLDLLQECSPGRYGRVLRSFDGLLIFGVDPGRGAYLREQRVCLLTESFLLASETAAPAVATTLVHEATHGWLFDRGISYHESIRHRVERICIRASLHTAQRLPDAEDELDRCRRQLSLGADYFSDRNLARRHAERLRAAGCPGFLIRASSNLTAASQK